MTTQKMREAIIAEYPHGVNWSLKVSKMPEKQVWAIYQSLQARHKRQKKEAQLQKTMVELDIVKPASNEDYHQIDMFEYMIQKGH